MATVRWVCVVVLFLSVFEWQLNASQLIHEDNDRPLVTSQFTRYRTFRPLVYHGREKRHIQDSADDQNGRVSELTIAYTLNDKSYILDLRLQRDLLSDGYFEKFHSNGEPVVLRSNGRSKLNSLCQYQGEIRNLPNSWVALSTCAGLSGVVFDGTELHYVEPKKGSSSSLDDEHFLMSHSDLSLNLTCGTHSAQPHSSHVHHHRGKRQSSNDSSSSAIRGPFRANSRSRYVELVLVVDNKCYENQDKDLKKVLRRSKDIANIVNALYAPLNIFVALVGVVVWTEKDEIQISAKGDETLTNFLHYRRVRLAKDHPNDNAQLLTGVQFQGGVVGKALKGPMCTYEFSGGVAMDHSPAVGLVATTVAHEMGHNFGMEHDNDSLCDCPDDRCIMAASSSTISPTRWSSCSLENLALAFEHGMDYCLRNKPASLIDGPECGNMFLEEGEECDCGTPGNCDNPCCNPHTCKLHTNATCATGECCDLSTCHLKTAGTLCRSALRECDLPEYCTGGSEFCPDDLYKMDGISCGKGKAYCYDGSCRSHSDQCRLLWGPSGQGSDAQCYKQNTHGNKTGNCGYLKFNDTFLKCASENVQCGLLHCSHLNERLEFGMESVAVLSHSFFNVDGRIVPCRTANVDLGLQDVDPGLVPSGSKCGDNKMCLNQTCVPVASVLKPGCPHKCSYNGECNNLGKCHCKIGFAPPHCDYPGPGGSEDGGPASDPNVKNTFVVAMYAIFLGIVPFCTVIFCCWYCYRDRQGRKWFWESVCGNKKHMSALPTRGSPDFTQPQSSQSTPSNSPSRRVPSRRRFTFWPFSLWMKHSPGKPVPAEDFQRNPPTRLEISQPIPLHPNGTSRPPANHSASNAFAHNLAGHFKGFTLSPLNEHPDSSFDSFDSAESSQGPAPVHKSSLSSLGSQAKEAPRSINTGMVAARANFFANGPAKDPPPLPVKSNTLPSRPAPAVPLPQTGASETQKKAPGPMTQTEITITKTIVPATKPIAKTPESSPLPKKNRPLSVNVAGMKAMFNKSEPTPPPQSTEPAFNSTLQKVASIFKPAANPESTPSPLSLDAPPSGGSALPRNQSIKAAKINRESLRGIEISHPIPLNSIEPPCQSKPVPIRPAPPPPSGHDVTDGKAPVLPAKAGISSTLPRLPKQNKVHFAVDESEKEAQEEKPALANVEKSESMRIKGVTPRPSIPQFGSMRGKRPVSMPFARPTSPPPNPPPASVARASAIVENEYLYDDCSAVNRGETDAIYASIDDLPLADVKMKRDETGSTTTSNSDGLLSEIVSELKKKNLDTVSALKGDVNKNKDGSSSTSDKSKSPVSTGASTKSTEDSSPTSKPSPLTKPSSTTSNNATSEPQSSQDKPSTQSYKPYSSSSAARNRYLGNNGTAGGTGTPSSVAQSAGASSKGTSSVETKAAETTSQSSTQPTSEVNDTKKPAINPIPLPQQAPVGKTATSPVSKTPLSIGNTTDKSGSSSADVYSSVNKSDSKKPVGTAGPASTVKSKVTAMQGVAGTPGVNNTKNAAAKAKAGASSTNVNNKPAATATRPGAVASKASADKTANRPAGNASSNSSLARPNATSSGKTSSSLVQNMQKKFDASGSKAGPTAGTTDGARPAAAAKTKTNAKQ